MTKRIRKQKMNKRRMRKIARGVQGENEKKIIMYVKEEE